VTQRIDQWLSGTRRAAGSSAALAVLAVAVGCAGHAGREGFSRIQAGGARESRSPDGNLLARVSWVETQEGLANTRFFRVRGTQVVEQLGVVTSGRFVAWGPPPAFCLIVQAAPDDDCRHVILDLRDLARRDDPLDAFDPGLRRVGTRWSVFRAWDLKTDTLEFDDASSGTHRNPQHIIRVFGATSRNPTSATHERMTFQKLSGAARWGVSVGGSAACLP
jgi:hypothetical protein